MRRQSKLQMILL